MSPIPAPDPFSSSATAVFQQDANGSRVSAAINAAPATEYGYDVFGDLASVDVAGGASIVYESDGDGLRRSRATSPTSSDWFVWDISGGLPLLLDDGGHSYLYGPTSTPLAQVDTATGDIEYLHGDLVGSVRLLTDAMGDDVGAVDFDPYGRVGSRTGVTSAFGYSGNWTDPDTGFVYLRARDYDPVTGQFVQVDPAVDETRQPYAYAGNNPLQFTDPTGLCIGMDGTPQDRPCTQNDFFWADLGPSWDTQWGHFNAGFEDGMTFNIKRLFDDANYCEHGQEASYWAGDVAGVLLSVGAILAQMGGRGGVGSAESLLLNEMAFGSKAAARSALEGDVGAAANRFFRGATSKSQDFKISEFANGERRFEFFSPAENAGYGKLYVQEVDMLGRVIREYKDTMGPGGLINRKWISGGE